MREKQERKRLEQEEETLFAEREKMMNEYMRELERKEREEKQEVQDMLSTVWKLQKDRAIRPEWDLNDPFAIRKEKVKTEHDLGVSSAQVFKGEHRTYKQDLKNKQQEQSKFLLEQLREKRQILDKEAAEEQKYAELVAMQTELRARVEYQEAADRAKTELEINRINQEMHALRQENKKLEKQFQDAQAKAETDYLLSNPLLRESREKGKAATGKTVRYEWKGMTPAELAEIMKTQEQQIAEREDMRRAKREQKQREDEFQEYVHQAAVKMEQEEAIERVNLARQTAGYVVQQHSAFQQRKQRENEERMRPGISQDWWPFGRSDR